MIYYNRPQGFTKIKSITLGLENCDSITFNGNDIGEIYLGNITTEIRRVASNSVDEEQIINKMCIQIFPTGNVEYNEFGFETYKKNKFERLLEYQDITDITIELTDLRGDSEDVWYYNYLTRWEGDDFTNNLQKSEKISGCLFITINYDIEEENKKLSEEDIKFQMKMYNN